MFPCRRTTLEPNLHAKRGPWASGPAPASGIASSRAARCAARGPVDQRKIACFASRKSWVQIPAGPLRPTDVGGSRDRGNVLRGEVPEAGDLEVRPEPEIVHRGAEAVHPDRAEACGLRAEA